MSCCSEYDDEKAPTARHLIHDLSSPWVDPNKPIYVYVDGEPYVVKGVTTTARGQTLDLRLAEAGELTS